jgi:Holliday junction resolvasome RuvABC endonuclease subunit
MRLLALDASTKSTGLALFHDKDLIDYQCFTASSNDVIKRITTIVRKLMEYLENHEVDKILLEEVRPETGTNLNTYRALMWLQAAIAFMLHEHFPRVKIEYIYPSEWRAACGIKTGRGVHRAEQKEYDIEFVKNVFKITVNDDIADAIGLGYSQVNSLKDYYDWS